MAIKPAVCPKWDLELFINDATPRSIACLGNVRRTFDRYLPAGYTLKVTDIAQDPSRAKLCQIVATPTLIKSGPAPRCVMVGDFTNLQWVLRGLPLKPVKNRR